VRPFIAHTTSFPTEFLQSTWLRALFNPMKLSSINIAPLHNPESAEALLASPVRYVSAAM
jgi:hypothetical protein